MHKFAIALAFLLAPTAPLLAHPDHDMEEPERPVEQIAKDNVTRLITKGKLPASWSKATLEGIRSRSAGGARQTIVTFRNNAEQKADRKLLYVVMSADGTFVSADHMLR